MRAHSLGYVGIAARDPAAWQSFGPEILGMPLADPLPDGTVRLRMDDRHHRIAINRGDCDRLMYLGWEMVDEAALEDGTRIPVYGLGAMWTLAAIRGCQDL
jgi:hypothetical protein